MAHLTFSRLAQWILVISATGLTANHCLATGVQSAISEPGIAKPISDYRKATETATPATGRKESVLTPAVVSLGKQLFFDKRLSIDGSIACASCHIPTEGFTQNMMKTSQGLNHQRLRRNTPTLLNVARQQLLSHDGRETSLTEQVFSPLLSPLEMGNPSKEAIMHRLASLDDYQQQFIDIMGQFSPSTLAIAIASFEATLSANQSRFDHWYFQRIPDVLSEIEIRGFAVFNRHGCANCHLIEGEAPFVDHQFHNTGVGYERHRQHSQSAGYLSDLGRMEVSGNPDDQWRYKTPTLRNIALTSPYMHDGSMPDLKTVIDYYASGGFADPNQDVRLLPFTLSADDESALIAFLESLTASNIDAVIAASLPSQPSR